MPLPMRDFNQCRGGKPVKRGEGVAGFGGAVVVDCAKELSRQKAQFMTYTPRCD